MIEILESEVEAVKMIHLGLAVEIQIEAHSVETDGVTFQEGMVVVEITL